MVRKIVKNIGEKLNGKYSQKDLDHAKQFPTDALETVPKKQFNKLQKQLAIFLVIKLLVR